MGRREDAQNKALASIMGGSPKDYVSGRGDDITSDQVADGADDPPPEGELEEREVAEDDEILGNAYGEPELEEDEGEDEPDESAEGDEGEGGEEHTEEVTASEDDDDDEGPLPFEERTRLVAALARDGLPERHIKAMTTAELLEYGAKRRGNQEDVDAMKEDMLRYKAAAGASDDKGEVEDARPGVPDKPPATPDLSELSESFGEEEASLIAKYVEKQIAAGVEAQTTPLANMIAEMIQTDQRSRLSGAVPDGIEDGWFDKVEKRAIELGQAKTFPELKGKARTSALFDAALRVEYPDTPSAPEVTRKEKRTRQRKNGVPVSQTRRQAPKKLKGEELVNARALMAASGKSAEEIQDELGT